MALDNPPPPITRPSEWAAINHRARSWRRRMTRLGQAAASFLLLLGIWWAAVRLLEYPTYLFPPPESVWTTFLEFSKDGNLAKHIVDSMWRIVNGTAFALVIGLGLGFAIGLNRTVAAFAMPIVTFFQAIPGISWIPLAILWFGLGYGTVVFVVTLSVIWPIIFNTVLGVRSVAQPMANAALTLGATRRQLVWHVYVPGSISNIVTGVRLGVAYGWRALVAVEMLGSASGVGWLIFEARSGLRTDLVIVCMITLGAMWLVIDSLLLRPLERATIERWGLVRS